VTRGTTIGAGSSELIKVSSPRAEQSAKPLKVELLKFVGLIEGDRPMSAITKGDCRLYKEHLLNERKLSIMTTATHLSAVGAVFSWAAL
jgi:hypothetical protein